MQMFVNSVRSQGTTIDAFGSSLARLTYLIRLLVMKMVLSIRPLSRSPVIDRHDPIFEDARSAPRGEKRSFAADPRGREQKLQSRLSQPSLQLGKSMLPWRGGGADVTAPRRVQRGHFVTPVSLPEQVQG